MEGAELALHASAGSFVRPGWSVSNNILTSFFSFHFKAELLWLKQLHCVCLEALEWAILNFFFLVLFSNKEIIWKQPFWCE